MTEAYLLSCIQTPKPIRRLFLAAFLKERCNLAFWKKATIVHILPVLNPAIQNFEKFQC